MLEHNQFACCHTAGRTRRGLVKLECLSQRLPQQSQIVLIESGLSRKTGIHESVSNIQAIGNRIFAPHLTLLVGSILFIRDGTAGNGVFRNENRVQRIRKRQLNRSTDLPAVNFHSHNSTECTNVIKVPAHESRQFTRLFQIFRKFIGRWQSDGIISLLVHVIQNNGILEIDPVIHAILIFQLNIITYLAFQADIRNYAFSCFRINSRHVPGIGVSIRICILRIKNEHEIVTCHGSISSFFVLSENYFVSSFVFSPSEPVSFLSAFWKKACIC